MHKISAAIIILKRMICENDFPLSFFTIDIKINNVRKIKRIKKIKAKYFILLH